MDNRWLISCVMFHYQKASHSHVTVRRKKKESNKERNKKVFLIGDHPKHCLVYR